MCSMFETNFLNRNVTRFVHLDITLFLQTSHIHFQFALADYDASEALYTGQILSSLFGGLSHVRVNKPGCCLISITLTHYEYAAIWFIETYLT